LLSNRSRLAAEVADARLAVLIKQGVSGLHIPVRDARFVREYDPGDNTGEASDFAVQAHHIGGDARATSDEQLAMKCVAIRDRSAEHAEQNRRREFWKSKSLVVFCKNQHFQN
jgi:hypothetical protein